MNTQATALRMYFTEKNIKSIEVAEKIGVSKGTISNILNGKYAIGKDLASKLSEVYGFDLGYLLSGKGSLFPSQSVENGAIVNGGRVSGGINVTATNAALQAENERLRNEVEWLRGLLEKH